MNQRITQGFTLIELLVVIAIISMLASIIFPVHSKAREKGRQIQCVSNQRQIAMAMMMWSNDHDEAFPSVETVWQDVDVVDRRILKCPTTGPGTQLGFVYSSFVANMCQGEIYLPQEEPLTADGRTRLNPPADSPGQNVLYEPSDMDFRHLGGAITSFVDGHVQMLKEPPALWLVELTNGGEFEREVLRTKHPVMVYFYTDTATNTPEYTFCRKLDDVVLSIANTYRLQVKVVRVNGDKFPQLAKQYEIVAGSPGTGYPVLLFMKNGEERDRIGGYPPDVSLWDDTIWDQFIANCQIDITNAVNQLLK